MRWRAASPRTLISSASPSTATSSSACRARRASPVRKTIDFAKELDCETIQVSLAAPYPGTEFYDYAKKNDLIQIDVSMTDDTGHQLPNIIYPGLDRSELVNWVERFLRRVLLPSEGHLAHRAQVHLQ